jgi:hypothetical protein
MAETGKNLSERLVGYLQEGLELSSEEHQDRIRKGGKSALISFLHLAKTAYGKGDNQGLLRFTKEHFGKLPKADQEALVASGVVAMLKSFVDDDLAADWGKAIREG